MIRPGITNLFWINVFDSTYKFDSDKYQILIDRTIDDLHEWSGQSLSIIQCRN
jgi:hypothetical protein